MKRTAWNADMTYDLVKEKFGDDLKVVVKIGGKESVFDLTGYVVDALTEMIRDHGAPAPGLDDDPVTSSSRRQERQ